MKQLLKYNPTDIEPKWQSMWEKYRVYQPDLDTAAKPFYNLMMFPYPSAEGLHVGNMYAFTGADIYGRFKRMQGYDVFEPIGLDGFGIHSENYAIKLGRHPREQAKISEKNFYRQLRATGNAYDWSRTAQTYDPAYYKWTQWIFIQLFKKGLAYRKKAPVNFCPKDKTVLADEQVIDGRCERCGSMVEKRDLEQWFFKITEYADRLLAGLSQIDWTEKVKIAQRNWIGKSEGALIEFKVQSSKLKIEVFTVFPETIFGVTYMVLAPEHPFVASLLNSKFKTQNAKLEDVREYVEKAKKKSEQERIAEGKEKTGVFIGLSCINPVNNEKVPIWVADYVLAGYGTGAVMGVPGSDHRDFAFAKKYTLPIIRVIGKTKDDTSEVNSEEEVLEEGFLVNSGKFSGLSTPNPGRDKIKDWLEEKGWGKRTATYHLRDWLISRQRYWGPPIPMVYCEKCAQKGITGTKGTTSTTGRQKARDTRDTFDTRGTSDMAGWFPVPEDQLPVLLPDVKDWKPKGTGKSPLASVESFVNVACPQCKASARRETDVSDTFLDSAWYFLRYLATDYQNAPFPVQRTEDGRWKMEDGRLAQRVRWLPVDMYIGGAEHSVLHLLYTRFLTMVFKDLGLTTFEEPFPRFYAHGLLIKEGAKMSKSRGNVVIPDTYIKKYGADTLRTYLMFLGPFSQGGDFYDSSMGGIHRFMRRVQTLFTARIEALNTLSKSGDKQTKEASAKEDLAHSNEANPQVGGQVERKLHQTIKKVTEDMEGLRFNTAIAALMGLLNILNKYKSNIDYNYMHQFLLMLAPFSPHLAEELYQLLTRGSAFESIHTHPWPQYDPKLLEEEEVTIVVQVDGKARDQLKVQSTKLKVKNEIENIARERDKIKRHLKGKQIKKVIYVKGRILNFVTSE